MLYRSYPALYFDFMLICTFHTDDADRKLMLLVVKVYFKQEDVKIDYEEAAKRVGLSSSYQSTDTDATPDWLH